MRGLVNKQSWEGAQQNIVYTKAQLRTLLCSHFGKTKIKELKKINTGCTNINYRFFVHNKEYILRFYCHTTYNMQMELAVGQKLGHIFPVPTALFSGATDTLPYIIYEALPGVSANRVFYNLSSEEKTSLLAKILRPIAQLQTVHYPGTGMLDAQLELPYAETKGDYINLINTLLQNINQQAALPRALCEQLAAYLTEKQHHLLAGVPFLMHGDYALDNLLINNINGQWQLSGIIDWSNAASGTTAMALVQIMRDINDSQLIEQAAHIAGLKLGACWFDETQYCLVISLMNSIVVAKQLDNHKALADLTQALQTILIAHHTQTLVP